MGIRPFKEWPDIGAAAAASGPSEPGADATTAARSILCRTNSPTAAASVARRSVECQDRAYFLPSLVSIELNVGAPMRSCWKWRRPCCTFLALSTFGTDADERRQFRSACSSRRFNRRIKFLPAKMAIQDWNHQCRMTSLRLSASMLSHFQQTKWRLSSKPLSQSWDLRLLVLTTLRRPCSLTFRVWELDVPVRQPQTIGRALTCWPSSEVNL